MTEIYSERCKISYACWWHSVVAGQFSVYDQTLPSFLSLSLTPILFRVALQAAQSEERKNKDGAIGPKSLFCHLLARDL